MQWDASVDLILGGAAQLGIGNGTTAPTATLDVRRPDTSGKIAEFHQSAGFGLEFGSSQAQAYIEAGTSQTLLMTIPSHITIDTGGDIILDSDNGVWRFKDDGTTIFQVTRDGNSYCGLFSAVSDMDMRFQGNDGGQTVTALTLDMSDAGTAQFNHDIDLTQANHIRWKHQLGGTIRASISAESNDKLQFNTGSSETARMTIDTNGKVGIGVTAPDYALDVSSTVQIRSGSGLRLQNAAGNNAATLQCAGAGTNSDLGFSTAGSERMRIDTSGNLLVGKTASDTATAGIELRASDELVVTRAGNPASFNRIDSHGDIVTFKKDEGTVGGIGSDGGKLAINSAGSNLVFQVGGTTEINIDGTHIYPQSQGGQDLGSNGNKFRDIFLERNAIIDGDLLVGNTSIGSKAGDGIIAVGADGAILTNSANSLADDGTLDIAVNTGGGGYQGFLSVANTVTASANARTQSTFSVFGRGTDSSIVQIATDNGNSAAATFTVTTPSNGLIRVTNTSGNTCNTRMQFFGGTSL